MTEPTDSSAGESDPDTDLGAYFGAEPGASQAFTIFLPDRDEDAKPVAEYEGWVKRAMDLLRDINGGVTADAPALGQWRIRGAERFVEESTRVVYSFIDDGPFASRLTEVRDFLHAFGRETRQNSVAFEFDGVMYFIPSEAYRPTP